MTAPIGVFDSGMGGLTVMRALMARLPGESFIYLGDTARLPYGTKSADTVRRYAIQASKALVARGVKMVVIACNTASVSLPEVAAALAPLPVLGVIVPGAKAALAAAPDGPIAVIATEGTVKGGAYRAAIRAQGSDVPIVQQACPLFVPLAEEGLTDGPIVELAVRRYLDPLLATLPRPKCLLLGWHALSGAEGCHRARGGARYRSRRQRDHDGGGGGRADRSARARRRRRKRRR